MNRAQHSISQARDSRRSLRGRRNRSIKSSGRSHGYFENSCGRRSQSHKWATALSCGHSKNSRIVLRSEAGGRHTLAIAERSRKRTARNFRDRFYRASAFVADRSGLWDRKPWDVPVKTSSSVVRKAPALFIKTLFETWRVTPYAAVLLGLDERAAAELLAGTAPDGRDLKDRIVCLYQIRKNLWALFQDNEVENEWLREPHAALDGRSPLDLLCEGSMENMLLVREYVDMTAGL